MAAFVCHAPGVVVSPPEDPAPQDACANTGKLAQQSTATTQRAFVTPFNFAAAESKSSLRMVQEYPLEKGATHRPAPAHPSTAHQRLWALWVLNSSSLGLDCRELDEAEASRPFAFQVAVKPGPLAHRADKEHHTGYRYE